MKNLTQEQKLAIDGCGLFFFKSNIEPAKQLEILNWYQSLTKEHREFVDLLKHESATEAEFFSSGD